VSTAQAGKTRRLSMNPPGPRTDMDEHVFRHPELEQFDAGVSPLGRLQGDERAFLLPAVP